MEISNSIRAKLSKELSPSILEIIDETEKHKGHHFVVEGAQETHFKIIIKSAKLVNLKRIDAHREIHKIIAEEIKKIHALSIDIQK